MNEKELKEKRINALKRLKYQIRYKEVLIENTFPSLEREGLQKDVEDLKIAADALERVLNNTEEASEDSRPLNKNCVLHIKNSMREFPAEIKQVLVDGDNYYVLLEPNLGPGNLYCLDSECNIKWQEKMNKVPYKQIDLYNNILYATDATMATFIIMNNGAIIPCEVSE